MRSVRKIAVPLVALAALVSVSATAQAHPDAADGGTDGGERELELPWGDDAHDDKPFNPITTTGPGSTGTKTLDVVGRGVRNVTNATTDVWAHDGYAYTGTFNNPCGGDPEAGVWVWDVKNPNKVEFVTVIQSPTGSRANDVRVAGMNSGDILVHSNESCAGGPGGFEIYDVADPANPVALASVRLDEINPLSDAAFGGITDVGVHNLFLFTQGDKDYVAVTTESAFDNFRIFDIADPANPVLATAWGAEEIFDPGVGDETADFGRVLDAAIWLTEGYGASANRFLHDATITADGQFAYLANWDAGLVLLDISDVSNPSLVSVALVPDGPGSEDGEVNSHSVWPSEDGSIVIEGEEDFAPFTTSFSITSGGVAGEYEAFELAFTTPIDSLPGQQMAGGTTYVGLACNASDPVPAGSGIALVQRGACRFDEKATNAIAAGYEGMVIFTASPADAPFSGGGDARAIPGVMVGNETGLAIAGVASNADLVIGAAGESVIAETAPDGWSGFRIWDYSDPANPHLASTVNTVCSETVIDVSCIVGGTYSSHNVIVETQGNKVLAYIAWYNDGIMVLDISDPANPVEIARYLGNNEVGELNDFWGIYKTPNNPFIYASDRNGGLYVFKMKGSGKGK